MAEDAPDKDIVIKGIFTSRATNPKGPSLIYADVEEIFDFVEYNRREAVATDASNETIDAIKKTIKQKGFVYDTGEYMNSGVAFPVSVDVSGDIQIAEGNHRLIAAYEVAQETGQKIYVPIYVYPSGVNKNPFINQDGGTYKGRSRNVGKEKLYKALRQLFIDSGASEYAVNEKVGETLGATKQYTGTNYLGSGGTGGNSVSQENMKKFFNAIGIETLTYEELPEDNVFKTGVSQFADTPTNVVDERLRLERIIKNDIQTPPLKEGLLKRYLDYDEFVKGLPADRAEQLLEYTNKDVADKLELFKDQYNLQKPYGPGELEDINSILLDWEEPSPIEDAVLADIENWDLDAEGNPIDPRKKPEGMSKFQQELSAQYNYLLTTDTPTNVVDEGIELYHSISKGETVNKNFHAGTYNAALDRASQFYGGEQLYKIANDNLDFIQEQANDLVSELSEQVSFENVDDMFQITDDSVTREVSITLPTGNEARFNIVAETFDNTLTVKFQDVDGYDGGQIYSEELLDIDYEPDDLKTFVGDIDIVDDETVASNLLDEIGLKSQAGEFNYKDGYDLYKVNIKPGANVVNIPDTAIFIENGIEKEMSSDFIQGFIERPKEVNRFTDVTQIIIDNKTYDITDTFTSSQALQEHFKDADVLVYTNDIEDVGSKSYMFLNENSYVLEKIDDAEFNIDVANKYIKNNPYETISKLARREAFTEPERYQVLLNALLDETDTPATTGPALLETRIRNTAKTDRTTTLIPEWEFEVVKPNKIFHPDKLVKTSERYDDMMNADVYAEFTPEGKKIYERIKAGTATDEDITRFFIYLTSESPAKAYAYQSFSGTDKIADIAKIGIFSDKPITEILPLGQAADKDLEIEFLDNIKYNEDITDKDINIILDLINEQGQFTNLKERMRNTIIDAHNKIYAQNPNDYFFLWRGGGLSRFNTWQSFSKSAESATGVMYQMKFTGIAPLGEGVNTYVINKNNMIDLDALGLSHGNEKEVIVLTEAANKPGAKLPKDNVSDIGLDTPQQLKNYVNSWTIRGNEPEFFPKEGFVIENISSQLNELGQSTQKFFTEVITGMNPQHSPQRPYQQIIEFKNPQLDNVQDIYNKYVVNGGEFNQHIFTSIPTFYETQIVKAQALENMLKNFQKQGTIRVLDIGGTEGVWSKTLGELTQQDILIEVLDPNPQAAEIFNRDLSYNVQFRQEAFSYNPDDQGKFFMEGENNIKYADFFVGGVKKDFASAERTVDPSLKSNFYDVVHESMTFQFIDNNREAQINFIADNLLTENGMLIIEEKFSSDDAVYQANEKLKDEFKEQYYTKDQLQTKQNQVLTSMGSKQVSVKQMEDILSNKFKYVEQYWDAGNFKGYIASNNPLVESFTDEIHNLDISLTGHPYSTKPTQEEIKFSVQKQMDNKFINKELAKELTKQIVETNKEFIGKASDAVQTIFKNVKSVGGVGLALGLKGLSKAAPVLEPGDVLIEKGIEKFTPQLNKAAQKLGFASLPVQNILPTYVALELNIAAAEFVQAAMYAYEASQEKAPGKPMSKNAKKFQEGLTKFLLPKEYEEEAIDRLRYKENVMRDFYNTPTGKAVLEEVDFGSQLLNQLGEERVARYSPGWNLSKAIFGLFGTIGTAISKEQANISEQTRDNMGQALLTGIGK